MVNFILESQSFGYYLCIDMNQDGYLNVLDVMILVNIILNQP